MLTSALPFAGMNLDLVQPQAVRWWPLIFVVVVSEKNSVE